MKLKKKHCVDCNIMFLTLSNNPRCQKHTKKHCICKYRCNTTFDLITRENKTYCLNYKTNVIDTMCKVCNKKYFLSKAYDGYFYCKNHIPSVIKRNNVVKKVLPLPNEIIDKILSMT